MGFCPLVLAVAVLLYRLGLVSKCRCSDQAIQKSMCFLDTAGGSWFVYERSSVHVDNIHENNMKNTFSECHLMLHLKEFHKSVFSVSGQKFTLICFRESLSFKPSANDDYLGVFLCASPCVTGSELARALFLTVLHFRGVHVVLVASLLVSPFLGQKENNS